MVGGAGAARLRRLIRRTGEEFGVTTAAKSILARRIEQHAASHPHSSAIITYDAHYTYARVLDEARVIARQLEGLPQSTRVLLLTSGPEREENLIVSFIAVQLAGLIPCLANPALDHGEHSDVQKILRPQAVIDGLQVMTSSSAADHAMKEIRSPDGTNHVAYIGSSSGTTGPPKYTLASTIGMTEFADWAMREFGFTRQDRWALVPSPWTDMGMANIWLALSSGAALVPMWSSVDRAFFVRRARNFGITVCRTLPRLVDVASRDSNAGGRLRHLKILAFGGDYLTWRQVSAARRIAPQAEMINTYGTAETSGFVSYYRIPPCCEGRSPDSSVPVGIPAPHVAMHVGRAGREAPGEILFSGRNLPIGRIPIRGYDDDTWESICGGRWIRPTRRDSGDLGFWAGGLWHLNGRVNRQAKAPSGEWVNLDAVEKALSGLLSAPCLAVAHRGSVYAVVLESGSRLSQEHLSCPVQVKSPDIGTSIECKLIMCLELPVSVAGKPDYKRCRMIVDQALGLPAT